MLTALYRHYANKNALLEAVSKEGFRLFRAALSDAWNGARRGGPGLAAMGEAYVQFALDHSGREVRGAIGTLHPVEYTR